MSNTATITATNDTHKGHDSSTVKTTVLGSTPTATGSATETPPVTFTPSSTGVPATGTATAALSPAATGTATAAKQATKTPTRTPTRRRLPLATSIGVPVVFCAAILKRLRVIPKKLTWPAP